jgi:hypothetical protein
MKGRFAFLCLACLHTVNGIAAEDLSIEVIANRTRIYLGEAVVVTVRVTGTKNPSTPDLSTISGGEIRYRGSNDSSHYSMNIVNGRMTSSGTYRRDFTYDIRPQRAGRFAVGPISVSADGKKKTKSGPDIDVLGIEKQEWVAIRVSPSKESVIVDEPFEITLTVTAKRLVGQYANNDPWNPKEPPKITIPYLEHGEVDGLIGPDIRKTLQGLLVEGRDQTGFAINDFTIRSDPFGRMFNLDAFGERRAAKFMLLRRPHTRNNSLYYDYELKLSYQPKKEGNYTFGPVEFKGPIFVNIAPGDRIISKRIFAIGPACTVRVVPPPEENRPDSFVGAVGSTMNVSAELDAQTCNVGDPLTLTLTVDGKISLENLRPPVLGMQENITNAFRVYDDTVQTKSRKNGKTYTYTIRPMHPGTYELPPIALSYFDFGERAYKTVYTEPIPIRAREAAEINIDMIIRTATNQLTEITFSSSGDRRIVAPITMDPSGAFTSTIIDPSVHGVITALGPVVFASTIALKGVASLSRRRRHGARRRMAYTKAKKRIRSAKRSQEVLDINGTISIAFRDFVADHYEITSAGVTPADVQKLLESSAIDSQLVEEFCTLFESSFNASFSGTATNQISPDELTRRAAHVIDAIAVEWRKA